MPLSKKKEQNMTETDTETFEGSIRVSIRAIDLLITTKTLPDNYEDNIAHVLSTLKPLAKTSEQCNKLESSIQRLRARCELHLNGARVSSKVTLFEKLKINVPCVFLGMIKDFQNEDIFQMVETQVECPRSSFLASISAQEFVDAGVEVSKRTILEDGSIGLFRCVIRGIHHQMLVVNKQKWIFVSRQFVYII